LFVFNFPRFFLFSLGINLVSASRVVLFDHNWNPALDSQAVCRAFRYGQTRPLFVYRMIANKCVEEKQYSRQIQKGSLASSVVDDTHLQKHFSKEYIDEIFAEEDDDEDEWMPSSQPEENGESGTTADTNMAVSDDAAQDKAGALQLPPGVIEVQSGKEEFDRELEKAEAAAIRGKAGSLKDVVKEQSLEWDSIEDKVLKSILDNEKYSKWVVSIHRHDALSQEEKSLNDQMSKEDQATALQDFEDAKNGLFKQAPPLSDPSTLGTAQTMHMQHPTSGNIVSFQEMETELLSLYQKGWLTAQIILSRNPTGGEEIALAQKPKLMMRQLDYIRKNHSNGLNVDIYKGVYDQFADISDELMAYVQNKHKASSAASLPPTYEGKMKRLNDTRAGGSNLSQLIKSRSLQQQKSAPVRESIAVAVPAPAPGGKGALTTPTVTTSMAMPGHLFTSISLFLLLLSSL
jgi:hypothetical protein